MQRLRGDFMGILGALVGVVVLVLVLMQGAYWLLTRPAYVSVVVALPGDAAWSEAQTDQVLAASGTVVSDVRWQQTTLIVPSWEAVLTYMTDMLGQAGWQVAGSEVTGEVCQVVAGGYFTGETLLEQRLYVRAARDAEQPPETVCVLGWALDGGGFNVVLLTASAPHPNW